MEKLIPKIILVNTIVAIINMIVIIIEFANGTEYIKLRTDLILYSCSFVLLFISLHIVEKFRKHKKEKNIKLALTNNDEINDFINLHPKNVVLASKIIGFLLMLSLLIDSDFYGAKIHIFLFLFIGVNHLIFEGYRLIDYEVEKLISSPTNDNKR